MIFSERNVRFNYYHNSQREIGIGNVEYVKEEMKKRLLGKVWGRMKMRRIIMEILLSREEISKPERVAKKERKFINIVFRIMMLECIKYSFRLKDFFASYCFFVYGRCCK